MFRIVEDVDIRADCLGGKHKRALRAVARAVHLSLVVDQLDDLHFAGSGAEAASLAAIVALPRVDL